MKNVISIILSVMVMILAGCGTKTNVSTDTMKENATTNQDVANNATSVSGKTESVTQEQDEKSIDSTVQESDEMETQGQSPDNNDNASNQLNPSTEADSPADDGPVEDTSLENVEQDAEPDTVPAVQPEPDTTPTPEPEQQTEFIAYSPDNVCQMATSKVLNSGCGKITTIQALNDSLAAGNITKEHYDKYYPYAGAGYMSIYVETDLSQATQLGGKPMRSEEDVADYIAGQIIVAKNRPYFLVECAGEITYHGTQMYEFRYYG